MILSNIMVKENGQNNKNTTLTEKTFFYNQLRVTEQQFKVFKAFISQLLEPYTVLVWQAILPALKNLCATVWINFRVYLKFFLKPKSILWYLKTL